MTSQGFLHVLRFVVSLPSMLSDIQKSLTYGKILALIEFLCVFLLCEERLWLNFPILMICIRVLPYVNYLIVLKNAFRQNFPIYSNLLALSCSVCLLMCSEF